MKSEGLFTIADVINSLNDMNRATVLEFHQLGVSLGCKEAISSMGKKVDDWKCEYTTKKPKRALFILRVNKKGWSIRCKLFNIAKYEEAVANCTERIKHVLSSIPDCEMHGGQCKGPVQFSINNDKHSKCRHYFLFQDLQVEDWACVQTLIKLESNYEE
ncbi:MAG TPA: hypothetical protein VEB00_11240 [Clostridia bacterium]|nr:hypothetical protein [Clostridia bacterium]